MTHEVRTNARVLITAGSEPTLSPDYEVAVGGQSYIQILVRGTASYPITCSGGAITGSTDFFLRTPQFTTLNTGTGNQTNAVIIIVFRPSSSGLKTATYTVTVEGTSYSIPLSATPAASASLAIKVIDGETPAGYTRETPCFIFARVDMANTDLPAPFYECYFKWIVTPPNSETLMISDPRQYDASTRNIYNHYPGVSIAIPVLEGQHGDWKVQCYCFVPGDDGNTPSLTSTQKTITVNALGTAKTTKHATATGRGAKDGTSFANAWGYTEMRANLGNNQHVILYDDDGNFSYTTTWNLGSPLNTSMVAASGDTVIFDSSHTGTNVPLFTIETAKSFFMQGLRWSPTGTTQQMALDVNDPVNSGIYDCHFLGDGLAAGAHIGDSFNYLMSFGNDTAFPTPMTGWPEGWGIVSCTGQPTHGYSLVGMVDTCVEVGSRFRTSINESCLRWLAEDGYPTGTETAPYQDKGAWYYNAVYTRHDMNEDTSSAKQTWRILGSYFNTIHNCHSNGEIEPSFGNSGANPANRQTIIDFSLWHTDVLLSTFAEVGGLTFQEGTTGFMVAGCYLERNVSVSQEVAALKDFGRLIHNIINITSGTAKVIISDDAGWYGPDAADDRLSLFYGKNILISTPNTGSNWFDDSLDTGGSVSMIHAADAVYDNIFPAGAEANAYDANHTTYANLTDFNNSAFATGNTETDITLDSNGRPNEDVSALGRDSRYYFDYFLKPCTGSDTWAGMAQSAATITRLRFRT